MANNKINKDMIPQGFTASMAWVDAIPVVFFGLTAVMLGVIMNSALLYLGAVITLLSGLIKVIWKFIVAKKSKNIWPLFIQMRIAMPIGFVLMIIGFFTTRNPLNMATLKGILAMPSLIFLIIGCLGMVTMIIFAAKLDSSDPKSNWIEQSVNGIAQISFFIAMFMVVL